jgi:hypothetical protein
VRHRLAAHGAQYGVDMVLLVGPGSTIATLPWPTM